MTSSRTIAVDVVDAFSGPKNADTREYADTLGLFGTFPKLGIGDRQLYADGLAGQLKRYPPDVVLPCHGGVVAAADLPEQMAAIMRDRC